jgi:peroxiredoxin
MAKQRINWRSFDDEGAINRQWSLPATPTFYIIGHKGTIRHKWVGKPGEKSVDTALEKLIQETKKLLR